MSVIGIFQQLTEFDYTNYSYRPCRGRRFWV